MATKITMNDVRFEVVFGNFLSVPQQQKVLAQFARDARDGAQRINRAAFGYDPKYTTTVDGRDGARLESVNPDGGRIVFDFEIYSGTIKDVIEATLQALREASPVVSGTYRDAHTLYVNGSPQGEIPQTLKPDDAIMIANPLIYARRLEIGRTAAGRNFVVQVPNRIYERVAKRVIAPRFGNQIKVTFDYVTLPDSGVVTGTLQRRNPRYATGTSGPRGGGSTRKRYHKAGSQVQSPAIMFSPLG